MNTVLGILLLIGFATTQFFFGLPLGVGVFVLLVSVALIVDGIGKQVADGEAASPTTESDNATTERKIVEEFYED